MRKCFETNAIRLNTPSPVLNMNTPASTFTYSDQLDTNHRPVRKCSCPKAKTMKGSVPSNTCCITWARKKADRYVYSVLRVLAPMRRPSPRSRNPANTSTDTYPRKNVQYATRAHPQSVTTLCTTSSRTHACNRNAHTSTSMLHGVSDARVFCHECCRAPCEQGCVETKFGA